MTELTRAQTVTKVGVLGGQELGIRLLRISDIATVLIAFLISYLIARTSPHYFEFQVTGGFRPITLFAMMIIIYPLLSFEFQLLHLYRFKLNRSVLVEWPRIFRATAMASLLTILIFLFVIGKAPLRAFLLSWATMLITMPTGRYITRAYLRSQYLKGKRLRRTIVIGAGQVGQRIAQKLLRRPDMGLLPVGFIDDLPPVGNATGLPYLGTKEDTRRVIQDQNIKHAVIAFASQPDSDYLDTVKLLDDTEVFFTMIPRFYEVTMANFDTDDVEGIPVVHLGSSRIKQINWGVKRLWDAMIASGILLVLSPLFLLAVILIKLESPGKAFFLQPRTGRYGNEFKMIKFRSMVADAEKLKVDLMDKSEGSGPMFKMKNDPRVTKVGGWLRKFSLDEVPQLVNVIKGDMSLVGPRPLPVSEARAVRGLELVRQQAVPGITGLWQVSGRSDLPYDEMVRLDYLYLRNYSFLLDLKIMLLTIPAVLSRRGAY